MSSAHHRSMSTEQNGAPRLSDEHSQTTRAFLSIRELLLRGAFHRGERIAEVPLSERIGVSRTPIRMALERLAHHGLLSVGVSGGFFVREFTIDEVRDAVELRAVLEGTAARFAAERLVADKDLDPLRKCWSVIARHTHLSIDSLPEYMDENEAFHAAILDLAKSEMLRRLLEQANSLPFAAPSAMVFPTSVLDASDETLATAQVHHRSLVEAIQRRESSRAEHLAREHARIAWRVFELALSDENALSQVPGGSLINLSAV